MGRRTDLWANMASDSRIAALEKALTEAEAETVHLMGLLRRVADFENLAPQHPLFNEIRKAVGIPQVGINEGGGFVS